MANESVYIGTDLKIKVELTCEGFSMDENDFKVDIKCGNSAPITYNKSDFVEIDGDWYFYLDTDNLKGMVTLVATLYVPDDDYAAKEGIRREVVKQDLFTVQRV